MTTRMKTERVGGSIEDWLTVTKCESDCSRRNGDLSSVYLACWTSTESKNLFIFRQQLDKLDCEHYFIDHFE